MPLQTLLRGGGEPKCNGMRGERAVGGEKEVNGDKVESEVSIYDLAAVQTPPAPSCRGEA